MGWKGALYEVPLSVVGRFARGSFDPLVAEPREILVLRPNDYGDLLTTTPIFDALRRRFPSTQLIAGVGRWGRAVVEHNPNVDEIVEIDAPWNNKFVKDQTVLNGFRFIRDGAQVKSLAMRGGFDVGIDVLGSHLGAMLMMRLGVRYRVGVRGYRGGWSACHQHIAFSPNVHVSRAALAQAELLGATDLPEARPQLYLTSDERAEAARLWALGAGHVAAGARRPVRMLVGAAAGLADKSWPVRALSEALRGVALAASQAGIPIDITIVGGPPDVARAKEVLSLAGVPEVAGQSPSAPRNVAPGSTLRSLAGETALRTTFAMAEQADILLTNPSMLLHVAAAFHRPTVAVLGGTFADPVEHDAVWGYSAPYRSVAPNGGADKDAPNWPAVSRVIDAVMESVRGR